MTQFSNETRNCQNCKQEFTIEPGDFEFYEKIKVPPPTFCPECRFQRRLMFRDERVLYRRKCDLCGKDIVSVFAASRPYKVYCGPCWWSDKWDALDCGQDYDPSRNFFEQFKELQQKVPQMNLVVSYSQMINSDYTNHAGHLKNCYLIFDADFCENTHYVRTAFTDKDSMDGNLLTESELCYWDISCTKCFKVFFSEDCLNCHDVYFSKNLQGCGNCFGCINLKNKNYHIFNEPHSKEGYEERMKEMRFSSFASLQKIQQEVFDFWRKNPHKFRHGILNVNSSGDYLNECKNTGYSYQCRGVEDGKYLQFITMKPAKDLYDFTEWGNGAEKIYECITVGEGASNLRFCFACWLPNTMDMEYCMFILSSAHMFGCLGLRKKEYCILNKQYSKEEYDKLRERIIEDMNRNPYIDGKGRVWKYGEFFPYDLSFFAYNEGTVTQYFPLTKEGVLEHGWSWQEQAKTEYKITLENGQIPDDIRFTSEEILREVFGCDGCQKAFRLIKPELELLKRFGFPLPRKCPDCRHMERMKRINPPKLWDRKCAKCLGDIKTSYAPDRPEIVYCESCYNNEVI